MRTFLLALSLLMLTSCGIKRPLIAPKNQPAYEEKLRKKRERIQQEDDDAKADAQEDTDPDAAPDTAPARAAEVKP